MDRMGAPPNHVPDPRSRIPDAPGTEPSGLALRSLRLRNARVDNWDRATAPGDRALLVAASSGERSRRVARLGPHASVEAPAIRAVLFGPRRDPLSSVTKS